MDILDNLFPPSLERKCQYGRFLFWAGTNSHFDQPFFDSSADHIWVILLRVVKAGAKLHHTAVLESLGKALGEGRRYYSAWVPREKQLRVSRLCQSFMCFFQC